MKFRKFKNIPINIYLKMFFDSGYIWKYSNKNQKQVNNQILGLISLRSKNTTKQELLKPISFVHPFTVPNNPDRGVLVLASFAALISFILSIIVAIFMNVYINNIK